MGELYTEWPKILLVDDRSDRIEFLQNLLFRLGYQVRPILPVDLEDEILQEKPALVLAYLKLEPSQVAAQGIALVMVTDEDSLDEKETPHTAVVILPRSVDSNSLLSRIAGLIGPGATEE